MLPSSTMKAIFCGLLSLVLSVSVHAKLVTKTVNYEQNGTKLTGYLAYDDGVTGKGKEPGVVVFPEWWGLNGYIKGRAEQLAKMGYIAFAADMNGNGESNTEQAKAKELAAQFYGQPLKAEPGPAAVGLTAKS